MNGYLGQMGQIITSLVDKRSDMEIVAGIDIAQSHSAALFPTFSNIADCDMPADVIIDFSIADVVSQIADYSAKKNIPAVICTTGLSDAVKQKIKEASEKTAIFYSANMSIGINLVANMLKRMSKLLFDEGFDIEILEKHHNRKVDAPSGTALLLADTVKDAVGEDLSYMYNRSLKSEKRGRNEIGIHSVRAGTIVGYHSVIFSGRDETIELNHEAFSKEVFAAGAIKAAKFLKGKSAGLYDMQDIMDEL
jgi:4-hydroxy-tetrahydrodipicolinate reductase